MSRWQARRRKWEPRVWLHRGSTTGLPRDWLYGEHRCHRVHAVTEQSLRSDKLIETPAARRSTLVNIRVPVGRVFARQDSGQTVVLVALMFTVLMGFAALGIDVGRFYSERRFVQDAVDAAALAGART
jgi:hypothetical protein